MAKAKIERLEAYKKYRMELHEAMLQKQRVPYYIKRKMSEDRIRDFYKEATKRGYNCHVSVGGLDSIVLCYLIREMGYSEDQIKFVSASTLEDRSIQQVHKELGVICVRPLRNKVEVIQEFGFPILSKKIANKIDTLQHPTEKNKTVRHAIITGECGEQGGFATDSKMRLPKTYLELFGGLGEEGRALGYKAPPDFKVSDKCCYYLKEAPCDIWAKENNSGVDRWLRQLPSAQPERTCVNCGRTLNNGGWYADGRTRCPIEEHYALPKDGYCHLWEKRNVADDDYPERRTDGEIIPE